MNFFHTQPIEVYRDIIYVRGEKLNLGEIESVYLERCCNETLITNDPSAWSRIIRIGDILLDPYLLRWEQRGQANAADSYLAVPQVNRIAIKLFDKSPVYCCAEVQLPLFNSIVKYLVRHSIIDKSIFEKEMARAPFDYRVLLFPAELHEDIDFHVKFDQLLKIFVKSNFVRETWQGDCLKVLNGTLGCKGKVIEATDIASVKLIRTWRGAYELALEVTTLSEETFEVTRHDFSHFLSVLDFLRNNCLINLQEVYVGYLEGPGGATVLFSKG